MLLETVTWRDNLIFANWLNFQGLCQLLVQRNQPQSCISRWGQCNIQKHFKWSISVWCDLKSESDNSLYTSFHLIILPCRQKPCSLFTGSTNLVPCGHSLDREDIWGGLGPIPNYKVYISYLWNLGCIGSHTLQPSSSSHDMKYIFYLWYSLNLIWCEYFYNSTMTQACGRCCEPC